MPKPSKLQTRSKLQIIGAGMKENCPWYKFTDLHSIFLCTQGISFRVSSWEIVSFHMPYISDTLYAERS